ncbi:hypothetical protein H2201_007987 [Coniosporium apollinis]|uniref:Uncharacterized protein n=1 Tax=Coniosporium apollinis TaxID=61459 RepID=A0ABQ9NJV7_9PEZI|nr:hypothetical protein H2201_007987 [Coniosporium apollinis]
MELASPHTPRTSRAASFSSDTTSLAGSAQLPLPPDVRPAPAYVSLVAASETATNYHNAQSRSSHEDEGPKFEIARFADKALALINFFLDSQLYSILSIARSDSLSAVRPAVSDVLKPKLAREAISAADEGLREFLDDGEEEELSRHTDRDPNWNTEAVWKRTRLRVMVYSRLGEMDEDEEEQYLNQEARLATSSPGMPTFNDADLTSWATANFLTSILEYLAEQLLRISAEAAYSRHMAKLRRSEQSPTGPTVHGTAERITVEEIDVEKIALNPTLGRLWRIWRKRSRHSRTPGSPLFSRGSSFASPSAFSASASRPESVRTADDSFFTAEGAHIRSKDSGSTVGSKKARLSDPAQVPLPLPPNDVAEIEVPGLAKQGDDDSDTTQTPTLEKPQRPLSAFHPQKSLHNGSSASDRPRPSSMPSGERQQLAWAKKANGKGPASQTAADTAPQRSSYPEAAKSSDEQMDHGVAVGVLAGTTALAAAAVATAVGTSPERPVTAGSPQVRSQESASPSDDKGKQREPKPDLTSNGPVESEASWNTSRFSDATDASATIQDSPERRPSKEMPFYSRAVDGTADDEETGAPRTADSAAPAFGFNYEFGLARGSADANERHAFSSPVVSRPPNIFSSGNSSVPRDVLGFHSSPGPGTSNRKASLPRLPGTNDLNRFYGFDTAKTPDSEQDDERPFDETPGSDGFGVNSRYSNAILEQFRALERDAQTSSTLDKPDKRRKLSSDSSNGSSGSNTTSILGGDSAKPYRGGQGYVDHTSSSKRGAERVGGGLNMEDRRGDVEGVENLKAATSQRTTTTSSGVDNTSFTEDDSNMLGRKQDSREDLEPLLSSAPAMSGDSYSTRPQYGRPQLTSDDSTAALSSTRPPVTNPKARQNGLVIKEPRVQTDSTRDLADYLRSSGPDGDRSPLASNPPARTGGAWTFHIPFRRPSQSAGRPPLTERSTQDEAPLQTQTHVAAQTSPKPQVPAKDPTRPSLPSLLAKSQTPTRTQSSIHITQTTAPTQPRVQVGPPHPRQQRDEDAIEPAVGPNANDDDDDTPGYPLMNPPKKPRPRMQARDASGAGSGTTDLIDFFKQGPPVAHSEGEHRIPRSVAPFRSTMDSEDFEEAGNASAAASAKASENSRTGLLPPLNVRQNLTVPGQHKPIQRRRVRDPYAIESDDEEEDLAPPPPRREEMDLADFLTSVEPPLNAPPRPVEVRTATPPLSLTSAAPAVISSRAVGGPRAKSLAKPAGSKEMRRDNTSDLADFLKTTAPPSAAPGIPRPAGAAAGGQSSSPKKRHFWQKKAPAVGAGLTRRTYLDMP